MKACRCINGDLQTYQLLKQNLNEMQTDLLESMKAFLCMNGDLLLSINVWRCRNGFLFSCSVFILTLWWLWVSYYSVVRNAGWARSEHLNINSIFFLINQLINASSVTRTAHPPLKKYHTSFISPTAFSWFCSSHAKIINKYLTLIVRGMPLVPSSFKGTPFQFIDFNKTRTTG